MYQALFLLPSRAWARGYYKPDNSRLLKILMESKLNWFEFIDRLEESVTSIAPGITDKFFIMLPSLGLTQQELELVVQSHSVFVAASDASYEQERLARCINGEVVSESESEDPEEYLNLRNAQNINNAGKKIIMKKRGAIKWRARKFCAKAIAERRFLKRKVSKRVSKIVRDCANIGETIETFVKDHSVGADAWQRTGVLTFDGNANLKDKVTYTKIQKHLEEVYQRKFAFGTVVQLCVACNKCHRSCKRYKGLAEVTTRRAQKGFNIRYNPDSHWSSSFYRGLNQLQYVDGRELLIINRDDATGFRLDTLITCKQYKTPMVKGKEILTTRTMSAAIQRCFKLLPIILLGHQLRLRSVLEL